MSIIHLLAQIRTESDIWMSPIHGLSHWNRVMANAIAIGEATGANLKIIQYFAYLHDCCRVNEGHDPEHGPRAAAYAKYHRDIFELGDQEFKVLIRAVSGHTFAKPAHKAGDNATVAACWDGDRLDLPRVGIMTDPKQLFSIKGRNIAMTRLRSCTKY